MTRSSKTRIGLAGALPPALLLALAAACTPAPVATPDAPAGEPRAITPLPGPCDADPATCAERQRKRDEQRKPARERLHPAGVTPPILVPPPEQ